ncbi:MAG: hypothetical protein ACK56F_00250, partial [bacterium]
IDWTSRSWWIRRSLGLNINNYFIFNDLCLFSFGLYHRRFSDYYCASLLFTPAVTPTHNEKDD